MPTDEQMRERELFAYVTGYDSRNAEVQALREALTEVTEELASELIAKYGNQAHPDTARRFDRDMELVDRAKRLLAGGETGETE